MLCVLRELVEDIEDQILMMIDRIAWVKDPQENLLEENDNFLFEMLSEVKENTVKDRKW